MPQPPNHSLPGKGVLGWLGRQVGYVAKAIRTDLTPPAAAERVVYQDRRIEDQPHPEQPGVVLRRTTVDEVIVPADRPDHQ